LTADLLEIPWIVNLDSHRFAWLHKSDVLDLNGTCVQSAGIILAERLYGGGVLLARHLTVLPDDAYAIRRPDRIRIDPVTLNRLIRPARDNGLSVLTIHTHPGSDEPFQPRRAGHLAENARDV
jgi:hypothetical protein